MIKISSAESCNAADWHLCFCYVSCISSLLPKAKLSNHEPKSVAVQPSSLQNQVGNSEKQILTLSLTHLSLASLLWDIGKQNSPRCDAAERGVPSGAILFALRIFIEN